MTAPRDAGPAAGTRSIRARLVAASFGTAAAAIAAVSALILWHGHGLARAQLLRHLEATATVVGANCTAALAFGDTAAAREALESAARLPDVARAVVHRRDGSVFAEFHAPGAPPAGPLSGPPAARGAIEGGAAEVVVPIRLQDATVGWVRLRATTASIDRDTLRYLAVAALASAGALLLAWLLLTRLIARLVRPVLELSSLTRAVAAGDDYGLRARVTGDDELATLSAGFNRMLAAIEQRDLELEGHRRTLEAQVAARTADLAATNLRLQGELLVRQRAEAALGRAAHRWRATFDAIRDGVCVLDADLRLVHANRALQALVGPGEAALEGRPISEVLAPLLEGAEGPDQDGDRVVRSARGRWYELRRDRVDGPAAEGLGFVQIVGDVTRQHLLQEQLTQAQKMEAVGRLAGGIAHDFNNVLSVIMTFASSLREELPEGEQRACAEEIERAGQRATALTRQLLAFSRKQVLRPEVLSVREVVEALSRMVGRLIGEDVRLAVEVAACAGHVHLDPSQLEQVLVNLAVNARDAMPGGGQLTVEARDVDAPEGVAGLPAGRYVRLRVTDTGTGMDAATLAHLYEPFFTTKAKGKGTGLGLAMVYGAVHQGGGAIEVESTPGAGTTFTLHLPRVDAPAGQLPSRAPATLALGRGERVLVVEDEPQLRSTVRRFLSSGGYQVVEAADGEEGLRAFAAAGAPIDLVLTDLVMPGIGGLALGRALRERSTVPVLYMSGYAEEVASGKERLDPAFFMQKPFDRWTLLARVRAALGGPVSGPAGPRRPSPPP